MTCSNRPAVVDGGDEYTKDLRCVGATRESDTEERERRKRMETRWKREQQEEERVDNVIL